MTTTDDKPTPCRCIHCRSIRFKPKTIVLKKKQARSIDGQRHLFSDAIYRTPKKETAKT